MRYILVSLFIFLSSCISPQRDLLRSSREYFLLSQKDLRQAKSNLKKFLKRRPQDKEARILLGKMYFKENKRQKAFEIFSLLEKDLDPQALFYYANILEDKNLYLQAKRLYKSIKSPYYRRLSQERLKAIEKKIGLKEVSSFVRGLLASAPLPQAEACGGEILYVNEDTEITPDNQEISTLHFIGRVLNDRGKSLGEVKIGYDSTYEEIVSLEARTITPEGRIIEVGEENTRDVSRYLEFPLYSNSRVRIVSMPQVGPGCLIEYKVKIKRLELINKKDFSLVYVLKEDYPIRKAVSNLKIPAGRKINIYTGNQDYLPLGINFKYSKIQEGRYLLYHWGFKDIPPLIQEPSSVPRLQINPYMVITSFSSWKEIYSWWKALYINKIKPSPDVEKKVQGLLKGVGSQEEMLKKIFEFCASEIRYVAVEYGRAGFEPHPAGEILLNKYGDCKDQSILLVSMLRLAGIKAWPVLISTYDGLQIRQDKPCVNFNHCIVLAQLKDGRRFFLDPTSETSNIHTFPFADEGRVCLAFLDKGYRVLKTPLQKKSVIYTYMFVKGQGEEFDILRRISSEGLFSASQRYFVRYTHPQILEEYLLKKAKEIMSDARLVSWDVKNKEDVNKNLIIEYNFKGRNFLNIYADLRIPVSFSQVSGKEGLISRKQRHYPLFLGILQSRKAKVIVEIPQGYKIHFLPKPLNISSDWIEYKRVFYLSERKKLVFKEVFVIKKKEVLESRYKEFKEFYENLINKAKEVPIFQMKT